MLFRLFPPELRDVKADDISHAAIKSPHEEELDEEFEGIFGHVSKLPIFNLVLPQGQRRPTSSANAGHKETHEGAAAGGGGGGAGVSSASGDKLDVGGETLNVSGVRSSDKALSFRTEDIPMKELPPTVTSKTTPI